MNFEALHQRSTEVVAMFSNRGHMHAQQVLMTMSRCRLSVITGAVALAAALVGMYGVADASLIGVDISTITSAGNSNNDDVGLTVTYLRTYLDNPNIVYLGTYEGPGNDAPNAPAGEIITVTSANGGLNGTWSSNKDLVYAFDVKAANDNALESVVPPALSGTWSTSDITNNGGQQPDVSHIDFFGAVPAPVIGRGLPSLLAVAGMLFGARLWGLGRGRWFATVTRSATG
jgi:hypothetical protein